LTSGTDLRSQMQNKMKED